MSLLDISLIECGESYLIVAVPAVRKLLQQPNTSPPTPILHDEATEDNDAVLTVEPTLAHVRCTTMWASSMNSQPPLVMRTFDVARRRRQPADDVEIPFSSNKEDDDDPSMVKLEILGLQANTHYRLIVELEVANCDTGVPIRLEANPMHVKTLQPPCLLRCLRRNDSAIEVALTRMDADSLPSSPPPSTSSNSATTSSSACIALSPSFHEVDSWLGGKPPVNSIFEYEVRAVPIVDDDGKTNNKGRSTSAKPKQPANEKTPPKPHKRSPSKSPQKRQVQFSTSNSPSKGSAQEDHHDGSLRFFVEAGGFRCLMNNLSADCIYLCSVRSRSAKSGYWGPFGECVRIQTLPKVEARVVTITSGFAMVAADHERTKTVWKGSKDTPTLAVGGSDEKVSVLVKIVARQHMADEASSSSSSDDEEEEEESTESSEDGVDYAVSRRRRRKSKRAKEAEDNKGEAMEEVVIDRVGGPPVMIPNLQPKTTYVLEFYAKSTLFADVLCSGMSGEHQRFIGRSVVVTPAIKQPKPRDDKLLLRKSAHTQREGASQDEGDDGGVIVNEGVAETNADGNAGVENQQRRRASVMLRQANEEAEKNRIRMKELLRSVNPAVAVTVKSTGEDQAEIRWSSNFMAIYNKAISENPGARDMIASSGKTLTKTKMIYAVRYCAIPRGEVHVPSDMVDAESWEPPHITVSQAKFLRKKNSNELFEEQPIPYRRMFKSSVGQGDAPHPTHVGVNAAESPFSLTSNQSLLSKLPPSTTPPATDDSPSTLHQPPPPLAQLEDENLEGAGATPSPSQAPPSSTTHPLDIENSHASPSSSASATAGADDASSPIPTTMCQEHVMATTNGKFKLKDLQPDTRYYVSVAGAWLPSLEELEDIESGNEEAVVPLHWFPFTQPQAFLTLHVAKTIHLHRCTHDEVQVALNEPLCDVEAKNVGDVGRLKLLTDHACQMKQTLCSFELISTSSSGHCRSDVVSRDKLTGAYKLAGIKSDGEYRLQARLNIVGGMPDVGHNDSDGVTTVKKQQEENTKFGTSSPPVHLVCFHGSVLDLDPIEEGLRAHFHSPLLLTKRSESRRSRRNVVAHIRRSQSLAGAVSGDFSQEQSSMYGGSVLGANMSFGGTSMVSLQDSVSVRPMTGATQQQAQQLLLPTLSPLASAAHFGGIPSSLSASLLKHTAAYAVVNAPQKNSVFSTALTEEELQNHCFEITKLAPESYHVSVRLISVLSEPLDSKKNTERDLSALVEKMAPPPHASEPVDAPLAKKESAASIVNAPAITVNAPPPPQLRSPPPLDVSSLILSTSQSIQSPTKLEDAATQAENLIALARLQTASLVHDALRGQYDSSTGTVYRRHEALPLYIGEDTITIAAVVVAPALFPSLVALDGSGGLAPPPPVDQLLGMMDAPFNANAEPVFSKRGKLPRYPTFTRRSILQHMALVNEDQMQRLKDEHAKLQLPEHSSLNFMKKEVGVVQVEVCSVENPQQYAKTFSYNPIVDSQVQITGLKINTQYALRVRVQGRYSSGSAPGWSNYSAPIVLSTAPRYGIGCAAATENSVTLNWKRKLDAILRGEEVLLTSSPTRKKKEPVKQLLREANIVCHDVRASGEAVDLRTINSAARKRSRHRKRGGKEQSPRRDVSPPQQEPYAPGLYQNTMPLEVEVQLLDSDSSVKGGLVLQTSRFFLHPAEVGLRIKDLYPGMKYCFRLRQSHPRIEITRNGDVIANHLGVNAVVGGKWSPKLTVCTLSDVTATIPKLGMTYCTLLVSRTTHEVAEMLREAAERRASELKNAKNNSSLISNSSAHGGIGSSAISGTPPDEGSSEEDEEDETINAVHGYEARIRRRDAATRVRSIPSGFTSARRHSVAEEEEAGSPTSGGSGGTPTTPDAPAALEKDDTNVFANQRQLSSYQAPDDILVQNIVGDGEHEFLIESLHPDSHYELAIRPNIAGGLNGQWNTMLRFRTMDFAKLSVVAAFEDQVLLQWEEPHCHPVEAANTTSTKGTTTIQRAHPPVPFAVKEIEVKVRGKRLHPAARSLVHSIAHQKEATPLTEDVVNVKNTCGPIPDFEASRKNRQHRERERLRAAQRAQRGLSTSMSRPDSAMSIQEQQRSTPSVSGTPQPPSTVGGFERDEEEEEQLRLLGITLDDDFDAEAQEEARIIQHHIQAHRLSVESLFPDAPYGISCRFLDSHGVWTPFGGDVRVLTRPLLQAQVLSKGEYYSVLHLSRAPRSPESTRLITEHVEQVKRHYNTITKYGPMVKFLKQQLLSGEGLHCTADEERCYQELEAATVAIENTMESNFIFSADQHLASRPVGLTSLQNPNDIDATEAVMYNLDLVRVEVKVISEKHAAMGSISRESLLGDESPSSSGADAEGVDDDAFVTQRESPELVSLCGLKHNSRYSCALRVAEAGGGFVVSGDRRQSKRWSCGMWSDICTFETLPPVRWVLHGVTHNTLLMEVHRPLDAAKQTDEAAKKQAAESMRNDRLATVYKKLQVAKTSSSGDANVHSSTAYQLSVNGIPVPEEVHIGRGEIRLLHIRSLPVDGFVRLALRNKFSLSDVKLSAADAAAMPITPSALASRGGDIVLWSSWQTAASRAFTILRTLPVRPSIPILYEHKHADGGYVSFWWSMQADHQTGFPRSMTKNAAMAMQKQRHEWKKATDRELHGAAEVRRPSTDTQHDGSESTDVDDILHDCVPKTALAQQCHLIQCCFDDQDEELQRTKDKSEELLLQYQPVVLTVDPPESLLDHPVPIPDGGTVDAEEDELVPTHQSTSVKREWPRLGEEEDQNNPEAGDDDVSYVFEVEVARYWHDLQAHSPFVPLTSVSQQFLRVKLPPLQSVDSPITSPTASTPDVLTSLLFRLRAKVAIGPNRFVTSCHSPAVCWRPPAPPPPPTGLRVNVDHDARSAVVEFGYPSLKLHNQLHFKVYHTPGLPPVTVREPTATLEDLLPQKKYVFYVVAESTFGTSPKSHVHNITLKNHDWLPKPGSSSLSRPGSASRRPSVARSRSPISPTLLPSASSPPPPPGTEDEEQEAAAMRQQLLSDWNEAAADGFHGDWNDDAATKWPFPNPIWTDAFPPPCPSNFHFDPKVMVRRQRRGHVEQLVDVGRMPGFIPQPRNSDAVIQEEQLPVAPTERTPLRKMMSMTNMSPSPHKQHDADEEKERIFSRQVEVKWQTLYEMSLHRHQEYPSPGILRPQAATPRDVVAREATVHEALHKNGDRSAGGGVSPGAGGILSRLKHIDSRAAKASAADTLTELVAAAQEANKKNDKGNGRHATTTAEKDGTDRQNTQKGEDRTPADATPISTRLSKADEDCPQDKLEVANETVESLVVPACEASSQAPPSPTPTPPPKPTSNQPQDPKEAAAAAKRKNKSVKVDPASINAEIVRHTEKTTPKIVTVADIIRSVTPSYNTDKKQAAALLGSPRVYSPEGNDISEGAVVQSLVDGGSTTRKQQHVGSPTPLPVMVPVTGADLLFQEEFKTRTTTRHTAVSGSGSRPSSAAQRRTPTRPQSARLSNAASPLVASRSDFSRVAASSPFALLTSPSPPPPARGHSRSRPTSATVRRPVQPTSPTPQAAGQQRPPLQPRKQRPSSARAATRTTKLW